MVNLSLKKILRISADNIILNTCEYLLDFENVNIFPKGIIPYFKKNLRNILLFKNQKTSPIPFLAELKETSMGFAISISCFLTAILFANGDVFSSIPFEIFLTSFFLFICIHLSIHFWVKSFYSKYQYEFALNNILFLVSVCFLESFIFAPFAYSIKAFAYLSKGIPLIYFFLCSSVKLSVLWAIKIHQEMIQYQTKKILKDKSVPIIIIGSQETVEQFIQEIVHSPAFSYDPQCILATENPEEYNICSSWSIPVLSIFENSAIHKTLRTLPKKPTCIITTSSVQRSEISNQIQALSQKYTIPVTQIILNYSNEIFKKSLVA
ncbi:MAG: hypothetical protein C0432_04910 [Candidatus Puniceispirillum sp.]|nr:hypothetical protein [Candidatus Pelagibacter sp.]MBA4283614.1 hypothetical protein [Candidatus Puniceispirillum sp.]